MNNSRPERVCKNEAMAGELPKHRHAILLGEDRRLVSLLQWMEKAQDQSLRPPLGVVLVFLHVEECMDDGIMRKVIREGRASSDFGVKRRNAR